MFFNRKEKVNKDLLQSTFQEQKNILLSKEYPALLGMTTEEFNNNLNSLWKSVEQQLNSIELVKKGNVPLLLVTQQGTVEDRIKKINGNTNLDLSHAKNAIKVPKNPFYVLLDVEDGHAMVAKSPKDALKRFQKEHRSPLTLDESIALLTYRPQLLQDHYLTTPGTLYPKDNEQLPMLWLLDGHKNPELHYAWFHIAHGSYGAGSSAMHIQ